MSERSSAETTLGLQPFLQYRVGSVRTLSRVNLGSVRWGRPDQELNGQVVAPPAGLLIGATGPHRAKR